ncbi:MAG: HDIG domain-containing metalloprotein [Promethearchaeota archaeon]
MVEKTQIKNHDFKGGIPGKDTIVKLLKELGLPENIIEHSKVVREIAMDLLSAIKKKDDGIDVDEHVVEAGALLHDIGRIETHGIEHGYIGGQIIEMMNIDSRVARCAMVHVLGGFDLGDIRDYFPEQYVEEIKEPLIPMTLEEKIVCLADKQVNGTYRVSLRKRFSRWFRKYGRSQFLIRARYRVMQIEKEINELIK